MIKCETCPILNHCPVLREATRWTDNVRISEYDRDSCPIYKAAIAEATKEKDELL